MQFIIEHTLILLVTMSMFLWSAYVGFIGMTIGHYRGDGLVKYPLLPNFIPYYLEKEKELWETYKRDDKSVLVALLFFGTVGFILGPMFAVSKAKKVEKLPVIDRRKV